MNTMKQQPKPQSNLKRLKERPHIEAIIDRLAGERPVETLVVAAFQSSI